MLQRAEYLEKQQDYLARRARAVEGDTAPNNTTSNDYNMSSQPSLLNSNSIQESNKGGEVSQEEAVLIRATCAHKGVTTTVINPKAQPLATLMGEEDQETREFKEGILSLLMRAAIKQKGDKHTWITFDGDVETEWVENLNAVLDDNRRLTLVTGESIPLTK